MAISPLDTIKKGALGIVANGKSFFADQNTGGLIKNTITGIPQASKDLVQGTGQFNPTTGLGIARNTVTGLPQAVKDVAYSPRGFDQAELNKQKVGLPDYIKAIPRFGAEIAGGLGTLAGQGIDYATKGGLTKATDGISKTRLGGLAIAGGEKIQDYAIPKTAKEARALQLTDVASNFIPGIGATKNVGRSVKVIAGLEDVNAITKELKGLGISERVANAHAPALAKTQDVNKVSEMVTNAFKADARNKTPQAFGTNDRVLLTDKATGKTAERTIKRVDGTTLVVVDDVSGIPYKASPDKFSFDLVTKGDPTAPLPKRGITFGELARQEAEAPKVEAPNVVQAKTALEEAKINHSFIQDAMNDHPGKGLGSVVNWRTGEFVKGGDVKYQAKVGQEVSNGGDLNKLDEHRAGYEALKQQYQNARLGVEQKRLQLKDEIALETFLNKANRETNALRKTYFVEQVKKAQTAIAQRQRVIDDLVKSVPTQTTTTGRKTKSVIDTITKGGIPSTEVVTTEKALLKQRLRNEARGAKTASIATRRTILEKLSSTKAIENGVKSDIVTFVKQELSPQDQGKALTMVTRAKNQKDLTKAFSRVFRWSEERTNKTLVSEIKKLADNLPDSIDLTQRRQIQEVLNGIELKGHTQGTLSKLESTQKYLDTQRALGKDVELPSRVIEKLRILERTPKEMLTTSQLEGIKNEIQLLKEIGKRKHAIKGNLYNVEKDVVRQDLLETARPIDYKEVKRVFGEKQSTKDRLKTGGIAFLNKGKKARIALRPIDGIADLTGMEKMKERFDLNFGNYLDHNVAFLDERTKVLTETKLKENNMERIGIYAAKQQDGGYEKLANLGITRETADGIALTTDEKKYYDFGRKWFESDYDAVKAYMRDVYNKDVGKVKNYVSFQTDFKAMDELDIYNRFGTLADDAVRRTKTVKKDFTESRIGTGTQKIKLNFDSVLLRHKDNVAYMLNTGRDTKMYSEIFNHPEIRAKLGDLGTLVWKEWLDLMARKGGQDGAKQIALLDMARRNLGVGTMSYKLSSAMVQVSSLADAAATIGGKWTAIGGADVATSKQAREFVLKNFPEIRQMLGDDIAFLELKDSFFGRAGEIGYKPLQKLDGLARSTTAIGAYRKLAAEKGIVVDFTKPDKGLIQEASKLVRQSQGSSSFKDSPLALTKGMFTGNTSVDKLIFQFQSFMLNRWENIERQIWRKGFAKGDYVKGLTATMWLFVVAGLMEEGARRTAKGAIGLVTGEQQQQDPLAQSLGKNALGNVPIVGNIMNSLAYDSNPVPVIASTEKIIGGAKRLFTGRETTTKIKGGVDFGLGGANLLTGLPGTGQASQIIKSFATAHSKDGISASNKARIMPLYQKALELNAQGKTEEAQALVDSLSETDYATYKKIHSDEKKLKSIQAKKDILPTYTKATSLYKEGKTAEAQAIVDGLTDDQYKAYVAVHKQFQKDEQASKGVKPTYSNGDVQTPKGLIGTVVTYAQAIGVDPVTAFNRIFTGQKIRRVDNGAIVVERMSLQDSQGVKKGRDSNTPDSKLDHTVPLELGGSNDESNLAIVPTTVWQSYSPVENALGSALRSKKITSGTAQSLIKDFKSGKLTAEEVYAQIPH